MEKIDFIKVVDYIFKNKSKYIELNDYYRDLNFFMVNRKLSIGEIDLCEELNSKYIDKASGLDFWFMKYKSETYVPAFYWAKNPLEKKTSKKEKTLSNKDSVIENYDLTENDYDFLNKYFHNDLKKIKL